MRHLTFSLVISGALAALGGPAAAQRLSFAPQIGIYVPTQKLSELATSGDVSQLEAGPMFGARLGVRFGSRLGIAATGAYIPTVLAQQRQHGHQE